MKETNRMRFSKETMVISNVIYKSMRLRMKDS